MNYQVRYEKEARQRLIDLEAYIAASSSPAVASRFVESIVKYCDGLQTFPLRGTQRDDLRPGLRTVGFRRRVTILFDVTDDTVNILGIYYGGQDYEADLRDDAGV
ncbi:MAG: type II toxin-antitoxin system RelE/ParE family toxin [Pseudomonadales bacterium]|nr:type II toxin-antitoxin system RelE/ParE family toxin [Pseudomonadales bacterium]